MKRKIWLTACGVIFSILLILLFLGKQDSKQLYDQFDMDSDGLIQVCTQPAHRNDDKTAKTAYYAIADRKRFMPCDSFAADDAAVYQVPNDCFEAYIDGKVLNRLVRVEIQDEHYRPCDQLPIMDDIFKQIALLEHELLTVRIFDISGEYFVYVELNVNLWTPCSLYYYHQERRELIQLYKFADQETKGIHILSADRLHGLN